MKEAIQVKETSMSNADSDSRSASIGEALAWIAVILDEREVAFEVVGGLAASAYGASREVNDIDLWIESGEVGDLRSVLGDYVTFGPERYCSEYWDCLLLRVKYKEEQIELADRGDLRYRGGTGETWLTVEHTLDEAESKYIYGVEVPVIPVEELVKIKRQLGRDKDLSDVEEILAEG